MNTTDMEKDWLAGNAVVAFVGALLLGQSWRMPEGPVKLPFIFAIPDYRALLIIGLFVLSLALALASLVVPLRRWALDAVPAFSPLLWLLILAAFILSWASAFTRMPSDQWWSQVLLVGSIGMFLFIFYRMLYGAYRSAFGSKPKTDSQPDGSNGVGPSEAPERVSLRKRMRRLRRYCRLPEPRVFWITALLAIGAAEVLFAFLQWDWLSGSQDSGSATIRNVGLVIGGSVALPLAVWRALVADRQASATQRQSATAEQGLLNERYRQGAAMLGSDVLSVRLGGVYALHRLAKEHPEQHHVQVMRLLCAFARNPVKSEELVIERVVSGIAFPVLRDDVQAVMDSIGDRSDTDVALEKAEGFRPHLQQARLRGAFLYNANLREAFLWGADLSWAYLGNARLDFTTLSDVNLTSAQFSNVGEDPATGLTQRQLDEARADPADPPQLGSVFDAETEKPLHWNGKPLVDEV